VRWISVTVGLSVLACSSSTAPGGPTVSVVGTWNYIAVQQAPAAGIAGTFVITSQTGASFQGSMDVVENDSAGPSNVHLSGVVSGQTLDSNHVDFDAFLHPTGRRHLGIVVGDSMTGDWVEPSGATPYSGSFRAARVSP